MAYPIIIENSHGVTGPNQSGSTLIFNNISALLITFLDAKNFTTIVLPTNSDQNTYLHNLPSQSSTTPSPNPPLNSSNLYFDYSNMSYENATLYFIEGDTTSFPDWFISLWTFVLSFVMCLGIFGNSLVPIVVLRTRDLKTSTNFLLVNLAVADILVLAVCLPIALTELHTMPGIWVLGEFLCEYQILYR